MSGPSGNRPVLYHAALIKGRAGAGAPPLCGARGTSGDLRYTIIVAPAAQWNDLHAESRCKRCVDAIKRRKAAAEAKASRP